MKSWKTTLGGILMAIGGPLAASGEGWVKMLGVALVTLGPIILGISARDNNVTSEAAGAK